MCRELAGAVSLMGVDFFCVDPHQIYIWSFKDNNDLVGMAFIDTQMYIHSLVSMKNLIIAADLCKSITLLRLQVICYFTTLLKEACSSFLALIPL